MDAVIGVPRLGIGPVELVRRVGHVPVGRRVARLTGSAATQGLIRMVESLPHRGEALMSSVVERPGGLRSPKFVLLGDQLLDPVQNRLLVHMSSIAGA